MDVHTCSGELDGWGLSGSPHMSMSPGCLRSGIAPSAGLVGCQQYERASAWSHAPQLLQQAMSEYWPGKMPLTLSEENAFGSMTVTARVPHEEVTVADYSELMGSLITGDATPDAWCGGW